MKAKILFILTLAECLCFIAPDVFAQCGLPGTPDCPTSTKAAPKKTVPLAKLKPAQPNLKSAKKSPVRTRTAKQPTEIPVQEDEPADNTVADSEPEAETEPSGLDFPAEMSNRGFSLQMRAGAELVAMGYAKPLDFADLARLRRLGTLIELPAETEDYVILQKDFPTMTEEFRRGKFKSFSWEGKPAVLPANSAKYKTLNDLAADFGGVRYDINDSADREQMRIRLLAMLRPSAIAVLTEVAREYKREFGKRLIITDLVRTMEYQIAMNAINANSYRVRDPNTMPPHVSGCVFDIPRGDMPVAEQNFLAKKLAGLERAEKLEALVEGGIDAVFHVFVFPNGKPKVEAPVTEP